MSKSDEQQHSNVSVPKLSFDFGQFFEYCHQRWIHIDKVGGLDRRSVQLLVLFFGFAPLLLLALQLPLYRTFAFLSAHKRPFSRFQLSLLLCDLATVCLGALLVLETLWLNTGYAGFLCAFPAARFLSHFLGVNGIHIGRFVNRLLLIFSSLDRIHAMRKPIKYLALGKNRRVLAANVAAYGASVALVLAIFTYNYNQVNVSLLPNAANFSKLYQLTVTFRDFCSLEPHMFGTAASSELNLVGLGLDGAIIALAALTLFFYFRSGKAVQNIGRSQENTEESRRQQRNATLGIMLEMALLGFCSLLSTVALYRENESEKGEDGSQSKSASSSSEEYASDEIKDCRNMSTLKVIDWMGIVLQVMMSPIFLVLTSRNFREAFLQLNVPSKASRVGEKTKLGGLICVFATVTLGAFALLAFSSSTDTGYCVRPSFVLRSGKSAVYREIFLCSNLSSDGADVDSS